MRRALRIVADAHGDGQPGHLGNILEILGVGEPGGIGQGHETGAGIDAGAGLVEADVAIVADPEDLEVDAAGFCDELFVFDAMLA